MHIDLTLLTALAVFVHLGTTLAGSFLRDKTDQAKIASLNAKTDQVLSLVTAIAPAVPVVAPKTISQVASDLASVAQALAALSGNSSSGGVQNAG